MCEVFETLAFQGSCLLVGVGGGGEGLGFRAVFSLGLGLSGSGVWGKVSATGLLQPFAFRGGL